MLPPSYYETRKLLVHLLPLVVAKQRNIFPLGVTWPIVVLRKSDGNIRICEDYKIGLNHKVYSDLYPIPNVEVAIHALAGMSVFTKIDLKTTYHQIPIDDKFKQVTTINTPIGLLKWRRMPYDIKTASAIFQRAIEQVIGEDIKIWFVTKTIYALELLMKMN